MIEFTVNKRGKSIRFAIDSSMDSIRANMPEQYILTGLRRIASESLDGLSTKDIKSAHLVEINFPTLLQTHCNGQRRRILLDALVRAGIQDPYKVVNTLIEQSE